MFACPFMSRRVDRTDTSPVKRHWSIVLRVLVAVIGVGIIVWTVQWNDQVVTGADGVSESVPGAWTMLRAADTGLLFWAWVAILPVLPLIALRWWLLMRCRNLGVGLALTTRMTMAGMFFNFCMPGATGGDLIKAVYAARAANDRAAAVVSIGMDRLLGLMGLFVLAGLTGLFQLDDPMVRKVTIMVGLVLLGLVVFGLIYASGGLRKIFGLGSKRLASLPGAGLVKQVDKAIVAYRSHIPTVVVATVLAVGVHTCLTLCTVLCGIALGAGSTIAQMFPVVPVVLASSALPFTFQGLGVTESFGVALLADEQAGTTVNHVVGMLLLYRLMMLSLGLIGSVSLLGGFGQAVKTLEDQPDDDSDGASKATDRSSGAEGSAKGNAEGSAKGSAEGNAAPLSTPVAQV